MRILEPLHEPVHDALVPVVAAELRVAGGRLDLEHALPDLEERDVERAAAEVEDEDRLVVLLVEPVGERRRRRLVDDPEHLEAGDLARLVRGLALRVVEVRRHRDDGLVHLVAQVGLRVALRCLTETPFTGHAGKYVTMSPRNVVPKPVQKPHPPVWVACSRRETIHLAATKGIGALSFSFIEPAEAKQWVDDYYATISSDEYLPRLGKADDGGRDPRALRVRDHEGLAALEDGHHRVRGPKVDSDCPRHALPPYLDCLSVHP